jgi:hypothetical protein
MNTLSGALLRHPERSEGPLHFGAREIAQVLRCAQDDVGFFATRENPPRPSRLKPFPSRW